MADSELAAVDRACSRFRPDSELCRVNGADGRLTGVSELFSTLLDTALRAAELTGGDVDPTCGRALVAAGYDRDFSELRAGGLATSSTTVRTWTADGRIMHHIIDPQTAEPVRSCWRTVSVAAGSCVDA